MLKTILFLFVLTFFACTSPALYSDEELKGNWDCYRLERDGKTVTVSKGEVNFSFKDLDYDYKGYSFKEKGKWEIQGAYLLTTAEGKLEKKVEIERLSNDTLILDMVDNGIPMKMHLKKE